MFAIIGIVVVIGAVIGGYLLEHGHLAVLLQPAELVIIGGAAVGTVLVGNPLPTVIALAKGIGKVFVPSPFTKDFYLDHLVMLNAMMSMARKEGITKLEADAEEPGKSQVFSKCQRFINNHHAVAFVCDTLRIAISAGVKPHELDELMELDMEVHHREGDQPISALSTMADALPGLGIVAAVLGVVITMGALGGPPEEIGHKVAAALVGTFLGILMCYGFFSPLAAHMGKLNVAEQDYLNFLRVALVSFSKGCSPITALEFSRRVIPHRIRPTFKEMEETCKGKR